jgi:hypothetical protein
VRAQNALNAIERSKMKLSRVFVSWVPLAVVFTLALGITYVAVQQSYRSAADDPQIQMAEDAARMLDAGADPAAVLPASQVELADSLAPFVILFDADGAPLMSNATLHGNLPEVPLGALEAARDQGENRVTWQPEDGVRIASVIRPTHDGSYVLAGRSLREPEERVAALGQLLSLGWLAGIGALFVVCAGLDLLGVKRN